LRQQNTALLSARAAASRRRARRALANRVEGGARRKRAGRRAQGLGKTVSMIALILSDLDARRRGRAAAQPAAGACADAPPSDAPPAGANEAPERAAAGGAAGSGSGRTGGGVGESCAEAGAPGGAAGEPAPMPQGGTLVVLPKTILAQWAQELQDRARARCP